MNYIDTKIKNKTFRLFAEKAAMILEDKILLVSDTHFGKAATFRSHGISVPSGTTITDLKRLEKLVEYSKPNELIFLGDLFHTKHSLNGNVLEMFIDWRVKIKDIPITLIEGNHDRYLENKAYEIGIDSFKFSLELEDFILIHEYEKDINKYSISGHVHPSVSINAGVGSTFKLPCFYFGSEYAILPAFGSFTGTYRIKPTKRDSVFVIADDKVIQV